MEVMEFTGCNTEGASMLDKATNEALEASFDDFAKTQRELNIELKRLKEAAKLVRQNKGSKDYSKVQEASEGRRDYKQHKKHVDKIKAELDQAFEKDKKKYDEQSRQPDKLDDKLLKDIQYKLEVKALFEDQIFQIDQIYGGNKHIVNPDQATEATAYDVNQLGDMPDLDPTSRENYRQYAKNNERVDELMDEIYSANQEQLELAKKIHEMGKLQAPLVEKMDAKTKEAKILSERANKEVNKIQETLNAKGPGRICIYAFVICVIVGVAYGIYQVASGNDACEDYNNPDCYN